MRTPEASFAEAKTMLLKLLAASTDLSMEVGQKLEEVGQKLEEFEERLLALEVVVNGFFTWPGKEDEEDEEDEDAPKDH